MFKNVASQKLIVYAHNVVNDSAETGDAVNISCFYSLDGATPVVLDDASPVELDSTNMPGIYVFDLLSAETNAHEVVFYAVSSTEGVRLDSKAVKTSSLEIYTWYVAKSGSDSNGGHSLGDAYLTIAQAVTDCGDGDTIIIFPGTYDEELDIRSKVGVMVQGCGWGTVIETAEIYRVVAMGHYCQLKDIRVVNTQGMGEDNASTIMCDGMDHVRITNVRIESDNYNGIYIDGENEDVVIEDCSIIAAVAAVHSSFVSTNTVIRNTLLETTGIATGHTAAVIVTGANNFRIEGCTLKPYALTATSSHKVIGIAMNAIDANSTFCHVIDCTILPSATNSDYCIGVTVANPIGPGSEMVLTNSFVKVLNDGANSYDLETGTNGKIIVRNSRYQTDRTTGNDIINVEQDIITEVDANETKIDTLISGVNVAQISGDSVAADNLQLQFGGEGLLGDTFPLRQDQGAGIAGGLAVHTTMVSVTIIQGSQQDLDNTNTSDDSRWTGDDDGSGAEFIFRCTPTDTSDIPIDLHFEGYYDEPTGSTNGATLQIYDFQNSQWDTILTFNKASKDEIHDVSISHIHKAPGSDTVEGAAYTIGDVLIKFKQDTQETGNACLLIDYLTVGYVGSLVTADKIKTAIEAEGSKIDHLWETTEDDSGVRRFTENALEQAPAAGVGVTVDAIKVVVDATKVVVDASKVVVDASKVVVDAVKAQTDKFKFNDDNDVNAILSVAGSGAITVNYYVYTDEDEKTGPIGTCKVWVTTDSDGNDLVASGYTDDFGKVTFYLDVGTYYLWRKKTGYNFTNPDTEVIT